ncbi:MAG: putative methyltransferase [Spirochaetes bacterium ADurb.Bin110]|nr:MAG: putative methyltransferase [Spirochaetes bacterium ADurb.Bin110]HPN02921.1 DNA methyltransferase [Rectinema sp.]
MADHFDPTSEEELFSKSETESNSQHASSYAPVTCLGITFQNDEARRAYFTEELRKKLKDPEFRKIEGFPLGADEDILALSDPPYYTACPNPWIDEFVRTWQAEKPPKPEGYVYHREPFAADVSEGKNDPIYNAHSYHTKVPHKAIMRYILYYTEPGDIVFDGFCGTGMTGVAAQLCGDKATVESLGYKVDDDGTISEQVVQENGEKVWQPFSKLGARKAVLNDLSPAATFIAYNYNTPVDVQGFEREAKRILKEVEAECGWMYETIHTDGKTKGKINYTVWSDVFVCPDCMQEVIFWDAAVDKEAGAVKKEFPCPHCGAMLNKRRMQRAWVNKYGSAIKETVRQAKQVPVLINYTVGKTRAEKKPDAFDLALIEKIEESEIPYWYPTERMPEGFNTAQPKGSHGLTHVHHFYTKRNLRILADLWTETRHSPLFIRTAWITTGIDTICSKLLNFRVSGSGKPTPLKGTLYISSLFPELNPLRMYYNKAFLRIIPILKNRTEHVCIETNSSALPNEYPEESVDYIFLDPPFGSNINYSELNFLWESWLKVWTNNKPEAIENEIQGKGPQEYHRLMTDCFREAYRVLKPGHWMTVEFSSTKASVWNSIQTALAEAGFIVANVSILDKQQRTFKAVTTPTAVKQDLIISAYKPNGGFEERFQKEAGTQEGVWDFVRTHLGYLAVTKISDNKLVSIPDRDARVLYDQLVAYYVRKNLMVPLDSGEFQQGLAERFPMRDGMYFLPEQAAVYDRKKLALGQTLEEELFVVDEASAIAWLRNELRNKPQTFQDLHPKFIEKLTGWSRNEVELELSKLLVENFLCYNGTDEVPSQIHSYLSTNYRELRNLSKDAPELRAKAKDRWYVPDPNKAADLERMRERALLKEFESYKTTARRLRVLRLEAIRAGFKKAWQELDYQTIVDIAKKIPENVLEEDPKLLMYYDLAVTRIQGN